jgi:hypothetical protein
MAAQQFLEEKQTTLMLQPRIFQTLHPVISVP